ALHAGVLPGYPASHGCIRMSYDFAVRLWGITRRGARVIVARGDPAPAGIVHSTLFAPKATVDPPPSAAANPERPGEPHAGPAKPPRPTLRGRTERRAGARNAKSPSRR